MDIRNYLGRIATRALMLGALYGCEAKTDEPERKQSDIYDVTPEVVRPVDPRKKSIEFVIDTSNSMNGKLNGVKKLDSAKKVASEVFAQLREYQESQGNIEAGVLYFADNGVSKLAEVSKFDYALLNKQVQELRINGGTPLGLALAYAERELDKNSKGSRYIVMLTDGENSVGKEPEEIFDRINKTNAKVGDSKTSVYLIAFDVDRKRFVGLEKEGATVYDAKDARGLSQAFRTTIENIVLEAPDPTVEEIPSSPPVTTQKVGN